MIANESIGLLKDFENALKILDMTTTLEVFSQSVVISTIENKEECIVLMRGR